MKNETTNIANNIRKNGFGIFFNSRNLLILSDRSLDNLMNKKSNYKHHNKQAKSIRKFYDLGIQSFSPLKQ